MKKMKGILMLAALWLPTFVEAEDGHRLWLRLEPVTTPPEIICSRQTPATDIAKDELARFYPGKSVTLDIDESQANTLGDEGYIIRHDSVIAAGDKGILYGTYALLRYCLMNLPAEEEVVSIPKFKYRLLNHWDNPDGSIERGYAGKSIFWNDGQAETPLTGEKRQRIIEYARANASIGINGTVLNNVNASPKMLTSAYLKQVKEMADLMRPYGIRVFLSINFATPYSLGDTKTADPADKAVGKWWKKKAKEIYSLIPDFGGFLVKANSEGQPGPGDYHRTHAEGANMLATALRPYGGIVMWRSFVYGANHKGEDRVKQAVSEFRPMDGKFAGNVILQSKNGPLDFQPREPYAPIFDNIVSTPQMAELQITQEYTGQSKHLVYLAPMWKEFFSFVAPDKLVGIAGVANIGNDADWCGHHFSQANWYAFGRLAWDPDLTSQAIAEEWLTQTFSDHFYFVKAMTSVMEGSREACVDYMMPLGLHHIFKFDHHYGPEPDGYKAEYPIEWCPVYYHKADSAGIGFDRTKATGSDAVSQYRQPYADEYENLSTCPEEYLLWFHHLPWDYRMKNGKTLWENLKAHYERGVNETDGYISTWNHMRPFVDRQRWQEVADRLEIQRENAKEWQETCVNYFESFISKNRK